MISDIKPTITAIVIAKNEADMISNCLETLQWCDEIIVIDHESSDSTPELAQRMGARVIRGSGNFAEVRNIGQQSCRSDWLLYIDADERVIPALAKEVQTVMNNHEHSAYAIKRSNVFFGHLMQHGGWDQDQVVRLFLRTDLVGWQGEIHEHAVHQGNVGKLETQLLHLTHRDVVSGLIKSAEWTALEAKLLFEADIPRVTLFTIVRKGIMEIFRRVIIKSGYKDGLTGWIEAMIQAVNRMLVYIQVWELQQKPPIRDRYQKFESSVAELWKRES